MLRGGDAVHYSDTKGGSLMQREAISDSRGIIGWFNEQPDEFKAQVGRWLSMTVAMTDMEHAVQKLAQAKYAELMAQKRGRR